MRAAISPRAPVVVKVGSSSLVTNDGGLDQSAIETVIGMVEEIIALGHAAVLVTSGAVAAGLPALNLRKRPADLAGLQAAAAVGQGILMERYAAGFKARGLVAGQVLLTKDVLGHRDQYLNARAALVRMLGLGIVPVVNENDTVTVEELRLGDNDRLAALASHLINADLLLLLTDTEGLYTADPRLVEGQFLAEVSYSDVVLDGLSGSGPLGSGGVAGKVAAARMAAHSGVPTIIASARTTGLVKRALNGEPVGTWVDPRPDRLSARKLWIAFGLEPIGAVVIDPGAVTALVQHARSLLPVGVKEVRGNFAKQAPIEVLDLHGRAIGRGLAAIESGELSSLAGHKGSREAIHRDDLVVLVPA